MIIRYLFTVQMSSRNVFFQFSLWDKTLVTIVSLLPQSVHMTYELVGLLFEEAYFVRAYK